MKKLALISLIAAVLSVLSVCASAQRMTLRGHVIGDDGKDLVGADILLVEKDTGQRFTAKTDKNGNYINIGVNPGHYHFTINKDGKLLYEAEITVSGEERPFDINIPKVRQATKEEALKQMTPEQRKQIEEQQKAAAEERAKIQNLNQLLAQAKAAEDAGNYDQAIAAMKQATDMDASREILWNRLAEAYTGAAAKLAPTDKAASTADYNAAAEAYSKAIALKGSEAKYHNNLGQVYVKLGKYDQAMGEYKTAAQLDPANAGLYYYNLGAVLTNAGKLDEANEAFDKAIAADPNRPDSYYWKGVNLLSKASTKDNKMVAVPGTAENLNKYLELAPNGSHAESAKELLASIGAKVETSFSKGTKKK